MAFKSHAQFGQKLFTVFEKMFMGSRFSKILKLLSQY
jgi:hypothetical protein